MLALIVPQIALASWWNPVTWSIWHIFEKNPKQVEAVNIDNRNATTTATSTVSEIELLKKEVEELKKQQTVSVETQKQVKLISKEIKNTNLVQSAATNLNIKNQSTQTVATTPIVDLKPQILEILNTARANYVKLADFSGECASMVTQRIIGLQGFSPSSRSTTLSQVAFDAFLTKFYTAFYDLLDEEVSHMTLWKNWCDGSAGTSNTNIKLIDNSIAAINNSVGAMTAAQLVTYRENYFGTDIYGNNRLDIQKVIDAANNEILVNNKLYKQLLDAMGKYITNVTTPSAQTIQYVTPVTPYVPQAPQFTRCTISGDGGVGLQAYINCSTSSF